jgi:competence protein ComEC
VLNPILRSRQGLRFVLDALVMACLTGCINPSGMGPRESLHFAVVDVGQGLSQIAVVGENALVWDMADSSACGQWLATYDKLGKPRIAAVIISHGDLDHAGGLRFLDRVDHFSGRVIVSVAENIDEIERLVPEALHCSFEAKGRGDTIGGLPGAEALCLWPPKTAGYFEKESRTRNHASLCCKVSYGSNAVVLTGDIDAEAAGMIGAACTTDLAAEILVVAHHGSKYSLHPEFLGFVAPSIAVISCGTHERYGHPDSVVVNFISRAIGAAVHITSRDGDFAAVSNRFYWQRLE